MSQNFFMIKYTVCQIGSVVVHGYFLFLILEIFHNFFLLFRAYGRYGPYYDTVSSQLMHCRMIRKFIKINKIWPLSVQIIGYGRMACCYSWVLVGSCCIFLFIIFYFCCFTLKYLLKKIMRTCSEGGYRYSMSVKWVLVKRLNRRGEGRGLVWVVPTLPTRTQIQVCDFLRWPMSGKSGVEMDGDEFSWYKVTNPRSE